MKLYEIATESVFVIGETFVDKLFVRGGRLMRQTARVRGNEMFQWGKVWPASERQACYDARADYVHVKRVVVQGKGYSGGHNTAARLGWPTSVPSAEGKAILWWDSSRSGAWTGYYPETTSLVDA